VAVNAQSAGVNIFPSTSDEAQSETSEQLVHQYGTSRANQPTLELNSYVSQCR
jgi:hypothetical protein